MQDLNQRNGKGTKTPEEITSLDIPQQAKSTLIASKQ